MNVVSTLRPGLLVSLRTSVRGNITYLKQEVEGRHRDESGAEREKWDMERIIDDPEEHELAAKVRGRAQTLIRAVCSKSEFGLLCPEGRATELDEAIAEAHRIVDEFNASATLTRISVYVIAGRVAQDDVEAVRAISSELRDLMDEMQTGLEALDVKVIREAANKARGLGQMLSPEAKGRLDFAVKAARTAARQMVKAGESAAVEVDQAAIASISFARTTFLDLEDETHEVQAPAVETARQLDLEAV